MPRGIPGSGPSAGRSKRTATATAGRGRGRRGHTLADVERMKASGGQQASDGASMNGAGSTAAAATGRGRGKGRATAGAAKRGGRGQSASKGGTNGQTGNNGQGRSGGSGQQQGSAGAGAAGAQEPIDVNGIKVEVVAMPGRGGRPQMAEEFPFGTLEPAVEDKDAGTLVGPSFLIPEEKNPEQVLAAARKRHKGKTFMSRKMEGGVRIWRKT